MKRPERIFVVGKMLRGPDKVLRGLVEDSRSSPSDVEYVLASKAKQDFNIAMIERIRMNTAYLKLGSAMRSKLRDSLNILKCSLQKENRN